MLKTLIGSALIMVLASNAFADCRDLDADAKDSLIDKNLENQLYQNFACFDDPNNVDTACNYFVGKSLNDFYSTPDFFDSATGTYMNSKTMKEFLHGDGAQKGWRKIGKADNQADHQSAADSAKAKKPTIAIWHEGGDTGHVALVLPGELRASGFGFKVARIAQTRLGKIKGSFIGCRLSAGFGPGKKAQVEFFTKD